jgi:PAS domain S-box-containing protein
LYDQLRVSLREQTARAGMLKPIRSDRPQDNDQAALLALLVRELRHAAIFLLDVDGRLASWNPGVENLLGFEEADFVGQPGHIIFTPEDRAQGVPEKEMQTAARNGDAADVRWHVRRDGTRIFVDGLLQALRDENGALLGFAKILKDATERQLAQVALHSTLESINDAFYAVDGDFRFTYISRKAEELWGRDRTQLIGRNYWTEFPEFLGTQSYEMHLKVMSERIGVHFETVSPLIGRWIDVSIYPETRGGLSCYFRDIEERKRQETQLRQLTDALKQTQVLVRSLDGTIQFWTTGCERLYGYSRSEALGENSFELLRVELPEPSDVIHQQLLSTGFWHGELSQHRRDGTTLTCASDWILHRAEDGTVLAVIESNIDITEQKRVQAELNRANDELRHFSQIVSHDLQAPVRMVRSYAELLSRRYSSRLDYTADKFLGYIVQGAVTMETLIRTLLRYAASAEQVIAKEPVQVETSLNDVLMMLEPAIKESGAVISFNHLPTVEADPVQFQQVLQNLIGNAIKYRNPGSPLRIRIDADLRGQEWLFSVHDNGVGIDHSSLERIFEPLERLHGPEIAGTGIGLAVCKRIVERHGGRIWVESVPGSGSTFRFTLPAS